LAPGPEISRTLIGLDPGIGKAVLRHETIQHTLIL